MERNPAKAARDSDISEKQHKRRVKSKSNKQDIDLHSEDVGEEPKNTFDTWGNNHDVANLGKT